MLSPGRKIVRPGLPSHSSRVSRPSSRVSRPSSRVSRPSSRVSRPSSRVSRPSSRVSRPSSRVSRRSRGSPASSERRASCDERRDRRTLGGSPHAGGALCLEVRRQSPAAGDSRVVLAAAIGRERETLSSLRGRRSVRAQPPSAQRRRSHARSGRLSPVSGRPSAGPLGMAASERRGIERPGDGEETHRVAAGNERHDRRRGFGRARGRRAPPGARGSSCPSGMSRVEAGDGGVPGAYCIDRYEGSLVERVGGEQTSRSSPYEMVKGRHVRAVSRASGVVPQGYISRNRS